MSGDVPRSKLFKLGMIPESILITLFTAQAAQRRGANAAAAKPEPPPPLADALAGALCACHGAGEGAMLSHRPPPVAAKWVAFLQLL